MAPGQSEQRLVLPSRLDEVPRAEDAVLKDAMEAGFDEPACFAIKLSLEEALANAIKHGNSGDPEKQVVVLMKAYMNEVCYNQAGNCVTMIKRRECRPSSATS